MDQLVFEGVLNKIRTEANNQTKKTKYTNYSIYITGNNYQNCNVSENMCFSKERMRNRIELERFLIARFV